MCLHRVCLCSMGCVVCYVYECVAYILCVVLCRFGSWRRQDLSVTGAEFPTHHSPGSGQQAHSLFTGCALRVEEQREVKSRLEFLDAPFPIEWAVKFRKLQRPASCDPGAIQGDPHRWSLFTL